MRDASYARIRAAAESDFEAVFLEHFPRVVGILTRMLSDRNQAEEIAGEVFWRLFQHERKLLLSGNIAPWLYKTATRAGIDAIRASTRRSRYEQAAVLDNRANVFEEGGQLKNLLRAEDRARVRTVLSKMKPAQAQLIVMRADGASYKELAEAIGVAVSGVGTLLIRAEAEFRRRYLQLSGAKEGL